MSEVSSGLDSDPDKDETGLLRHSVETARDEWGRRYPHSVSNRIVDDSVVELFEALATAPGAEIPESLCTPTSLLAVRTMLLDLARRTYVGVAGSDVMPAGVESSPDPQRHLDRLVRFEEVRAALEPEWDEQVEAGLSGPRSHELLAEIGHDLRSPLTSILFLSEVLRSSPGIRVDPQQGRQLGLIYSGALTMLNIVNNFMELSRQGGEPSDPESTLFSLTELMESTRRTVQPMADEKGLDLDMVLEPLGSDRRIGHPVALSRVLLNLATNALKFTEEGRVDIRAIEIMPGTMEFGITDSGPGIEASQRDSIFSVFDPAQDRTGVRFSGTGLGLVIVRRLLRRMDSELDCRSEPGEGTTMSFRVELPTTG